MLANSVNGLYCEPAVSLFAMDQMDIDEIIRRNLKRLIEREGLQQNRLADLVGVVPSVINDILAGRRPIGKDTMMRLCRALKVDLWEFYVTEKTPIVMDTKERRALDLFRQADAAMIAEEIVHYAEYRLRGAKKEEVSESKDSEKRKIAKELYKEGVRRGMSHEMDALLGKIADKRKKDGGKKKTG